MRCSPKHAGCGQTVETRVNGASCVEFVRDEDPAILPNNSVIRFTDTVYFWQGRSLRSVRSERKARIGRGETPADYTVEFESGAVLPVRKLHRLQAAVVEYVPRSLKARSCRIVAQLEEHGIVEI